MKHGKAIRLATFATSMATAVFGAVGYASSADASANVISGIVRGAQGEAVAGAQVQLNAFAVDKSGVHEISIASTTSDASGRYAFTAPTASQTTALADIDAGTINYEVDATSASGGVLQTATTTAPASGVSSTSPQARAAALIPTTGSIDLKLQPLETAGGEAARVQVRPQRDCTNNYPSWNTVSTGTYNVIIGEPHNYIGMTLQYAYTQNATTTVGVALTANGGGSWSASGSASTTTTSGAGVTSPWSPNHYAPYVYGQFVYAKQRETFNCTGASNTYRIVPQYWTGGVTTSGNLTAYDGGNSPIFKNDVAHGHQYMINEPVGYTFYKTGGAGATYGGGVNFSGINLSSNTAYSSSVTYTWKMDNNKSIPHYLFGASNWPAQGSGATIIYSN